eukprot:Lithocolla_globosa_v1_NODE_914_length_3089_cov_3.826302.p3 type:complete len:130 gc:universal NODE_914_length_3089_cov_3.826302:2748-2359(-)
MYARKLSVVTLFVVKPRSRTGTNPGSLAYSIISSIVIAAFWDKVSFEHPQTWRREGTNSNSNSDSALVSPFVTQARLDNSSQAVPDNILLRLTTQFLMASFNSRTEEMTNFLFKGLFSIICFHLMSSLL